MTRIRYLPRLADIVLPGDILDSLTEFVSRMRHHRLVFEQWGMGKVATTAYTAGTVVRAAVSRTSVRKAIAKGAIEGLRTP